MNYILYKIENKLNGKLYIGQTITSIAIRWRGHKHSFNRGVQTKLYDAMRKYGFLNFSISELCRVNNIDELNELEEFIINDLNLINNGYNMKHGGENRKCSDEVKQKISARFLGKPLSAEHKEKLRLSHLGYKPTEETLAKMREAQKNRPPVSDETKRKLRETKKNIPIETCKRISDAKKGKPLTEAHKAALRKPKSVRKQEINNDGE